MWEERRYSVNQKAIRKIQVFNRKMVKQVADVQSVWPWNSCDLVACFLFVGMWFGLLAGLNFEDEAYETFILSIGASPNPLIRFSDRGPTYDQFSPLAYPFLLELAMFLFWQWPEYYSHRWFLSLLVYMRWGSNPGYVTSSCLCGLPFHLSGLLFHAYVGSLLGPSPLGRSTNEKFIWCIVIKIWGTILITSPSTIHIQAYESFSIFWWSL